MRWALAVRAQDGATPVSAAGTVIICPKTVHGAKTTILCQVINVIGTVDGTTAPAGSRGVDVDVIERTPPLSPVCPSSLCFSGYRTMQATEQSPEVLGKTPGLKSSKCQGCAVFLKFSIVPKSFHSILMN